MTAPELIPFIAATDLGGLALGALALWGSKRGRRATWMETGLRFAALGAVMAAATYLAGMAMGSAFLVLRLWCHVLFCVLVPLMLVRALQRRGRVGWALVLVGLCAEGAYLWARHVEPYRLQVRHEVVKRPPGSEFGALRILVLADLQTDAIGAFEEEVFARIDEERPDLVLIPGDLIQPLPRNFERVRSDVMRLFRALEHPPRLGFLMVAGDCEPAGVQFDAAGIRMLDDECVVFEEEGIQVIGLTRAASRAPLDERFAARARGFEGQTFVMGHAPEFSMSASESGAPLVCIAGHTHGGQVVVPFFGPLVTLSRIPRHMAAGGFFPLGGDAWLCLSRGLGMERHHAPRIRFLCPPEIVVIDLLPA